MRGGINVAARLPPAALRSAINRARSAMYPPIPLSLYDLGQLMNNGQLPMLTTSDDGRDNIFGGVVHGNGFTSIVFLSRRMRRFMRRVRMVFCDGTFSSRPSEPNSGQVLQLCAVVRNHVGISRMLLHNFTVECIFTQAYRRSMFLFQIVPLAQILMSGKTEQEYTAVLHHIRRMVPNFRPSVVMTDYEPAMQNAWEHVFNARVVGCYWHYCRVSNQTCIIDLAQSNHSTL